jgi:putative endonuclease
VYEVYIIKSTVTGRYYIGQTNDLNDRIRRHNSGYELSTKKGVPWRLIHNEEFTTRTEAMKRERKIKSYKGGDAFKKLIAL